MKSIILIAIIAAVASPILAEEAVAEAKKQDKRGVLGLGYGGYYSGLGGLSGYPGYGGYYNSHYSAPLHAAVPSYSHAPAVSYSSHVGPYHAPVYSSPLRLGYTNLGYNHGVGLGHGINYLHGGNYW